MASKIPWFLCTFFAVLSMIGWSKVFDIEKRKQINTETRKEIIREIISKKSTLTISQKDEVEVLDKETLQTCMENTQIQQEIKEKAEEMAVQISSEVLENYKEEEKQKEEQQVNEYMDAMEDFFSNAVNQYAEEFDIEPEISEQLHLIIENGFAKQRDLYQQKKQGLFTDEEYERFRNEAKMEDRRAIHELLGEEGAKDFGHILGEEGRKAREEKFKESE